MSASVLAEWALFLALSAVALGGSAMMLLTMSMYRAGLFLMVSFLGLAGMFFLLQADLLAVIQIMMNVGGMLVMILFMVMLMIDPGGEMMWDMKRQMKLPGPGAFSMSMPRGAPPVAEESAATAHAGHAGDAPAAPEGVWTCPMHSEVRSDEPGKCPKCGMDLVPAESLGTGGSQGE
jgi:NADH-quinone oxidoreductase subunit J